MAHSKLLPLSVVMVASATVKKKGVPKVLKISVFQLGEEAGHTPLPVCYVQNIIIMLKNEVVPHK